MKVQKVEKSYACVNGYQITYDQGAAILPICLGSGYYNSSRIDELITYCASNFSQTKIFIPDVLDVHRNIALGYAEKKAQSISRLQGNRYRNHCKKFMDSLDAQIEIIYGKEDLEPNILYANSLQSITTLYKENRQFHSDARKTSRKVLINNPRAKITHMKEAVDEAVLYLIKEFAFLNVASKLFNVPQLVYVYHERWEIFEKFVNGDYDNIKKKDLGLLVLHP